MIEVEHLTRRYGALTAVDDVSFSVAEGEIVGLLGHNGAGKTTIMKMLTGYLEPTSGAAAVAGLDVRDHPRLVQSLTGYLPENCPVYPDMTVVDFLHYAGALRKAAPGRLTGLVREAILATGLQEKADSPIERLSRGFRQRVGVAQAILTKPKIIILDEPTNGLDPTQILQMRALIKRLAQTATLIISTHILQEVQAICSRVLVIRRGQLALDAPMADVEGQARLRVEVRGPTPAVRAALAGVNGVEAVADAPAPDPDASALVLTLASDVDPREAAPAVARALHGLGVDLLSLSREKQDLETLFAHISAEASPSPEMAEAAHG